VIAAAVVTAALARPDATPPAGSAPIAAQGGDPAGADPEVSAGVGGVPGASGGAPSGTPGQPVGPVDPRQADQPTMTTTAPPGGNPGTPTVAPTTAGPAPVEGSDSRYGNTVIVQCVGETATVTGATAAELWEVRRDRPGPDTRVSVRFRSATVEPYLTAAKGWCINGAPQFSWQDG